MTNETLERKAGENSTLERVLGTKLAELADSIVWKKHSDGKRTMEFPEKFDLRDYGITAYNYLNKRGYRLPNDRSNEEKEGLGLKWISQANPNALRGFLEKVIEGLNDGSNFEKNQEKFRPAYEVLKFKDYLEGELAVHFTSHQRHKSLSNNGFLYGYPEIRGIGLTRRRNSEQVEILETETQGYNFAFRLSDLIAGNFRDKAGRFALCDTAVVFKLNRGVYATHRADSNDQVIFLGEEVRPKDMIPIGHGGESGWYYNSPSGRMFISRVKNGTLRPTNPNNIQETLDFIRNNSDSILMEEGERVGF